MAIASLIAQILGNNASKERSNENFNNQYYLQLEQERMEKEKEQRQRGYKKEDIEFDKKTKQFDSDLAVKQAREQARNSYLLSKGIDPQFIKEAEALSNAAEQSVMAELQQKKQEAQTGTEASRIKNKGQLTTEGDVLRKLVSDASMAAGDSEFQKGQLESPDFQDARKASFRASYLKPVAELGRLTTQSVSPGEFVRRPGSSDPYLSKFITPMTGQGMTQGETTKMMNIGGMSFPQTQRTVTPGAIEFGSQEFNIRDLPAGAQSMPATQAAPTIPQNLISKPQGLPPALQGTNLEEQLMNSLITKEAITNQILRPRTAEEEALLKKRKQEEAAKQGIRPFPNR